MSVARGTGTIVVAMVLLLSPWRVPSAAAGDRYALRCCACSATLLNAAG